MIWYKFRTQEPQHLPPHEIRTFCPSHARREMDAFFYVLVRFRISRSPVHSSLLSLIADYNPNHRLFTQTMTTNFNEFLEKIKT